MLGALHVIGLRRPTQNQLFYIWHEDDDLAEPFIMHVGWTCHRPTTFLRPQPGKDASHWC